MGLALTLERLVTVATEGNVQRHLHEDNNNSYAGITGVILPNKIQTNETRYRLTRTGKESFQRRLHV